MQNNHRVTDYEGTNFRISARLFCQVRLVPYVAFCWVTAKLGTPQSAAARFLLIGSYRNEEVLLQFFSPFLQLHVCSEYMSKLLHDINTF